MDSIRQAVRDLQWAVSSPSLVSVAESITFEHNPPPVLAEHEIDELHDHLKKNTGFRVGRYFESLIHYWLEKCQCFKVVEHGLQIEAENRTIGEIDFLYENSAGVLNHLEVAVKFYLHTSTNVAGSSNFVGPNPADNFESKFRKLLDSQLPLSIQFFPLVKERQIIMKGLIFYHPRQSEPVEYPDGLSSLHQKGHWIYASERHLLKDYGADVRFIILRKPHWLASPVSSFPFDSCMDRRSVEKIISSHFLESRRPILMSIVENQDELIRECDRVFVVSDSWPGN